MSPYRINVSIKDKTFMIEFDEPFLAGDKICFDAVGIPYVERDGRVLDTLVVASPREVWTGAEQGQEKP